MKPTNHMVLAVSSNVGALILPPGHGKMKMGPSRTIRCKKNKSGAGPSRMYCDRSEVLGVVSHAEICSSENAHKVFSRTWHQVNGSYDLYIKLENSMYNLRQNAQPLTSLSVPQTAMFIMDTKLRQVSQEQRLMPDTKLAKLKTATVKPNNGLSAGSSERVKERKIPHAHGFVNYSRLQIHCSSITASRNQVLYGSLGCNMKSSTQELPTKPKVRPLTLIPALCSLLVAWSQHSQGYI